ncbi:MAG TPA: polysaccharide biosynthesis/export family protein [Candidatus Binatia bacterium]|nr:polysaccharide biosynthesis/export family protein [Candidatus Binatia bacterium]
MKNISNNPVHGRAAVLFPGMLLAAVLLFAGCSTVTTEKAVLESVRAAQKAESESLALRAGDVVKVSIPGTANLDTAQEIRRDGKIVLPLIGEVTAAGLTPAKLQADLIQRYASQISTKQVVVTVESSSFAVFVTGYVVHPGKVLSNHPITALEAVMEAGGFDYATANLKDVRVIRNENGVMKKYSLNLQLVLDGKQSQPFYLMPLDIVYVPERFVLF